MKYIELFAGIGGFGLALDRAGHECVYANDYDKYVCQIYKYNFRRDVDNRDIRIIKSSEIPDGDILVGGFPCPDFSVAGKRAGFSGKQGDLFFEVVRILRDKKPRYFILENVRGLLSHDNGQTFRRVIGALVELGYCVQWQLLNSKDFGVPQNRERVFIVGNFGDERRPEIFPITETDGACPKEFSANTIDANYWKGIDNHGQRTAIVESLNNQPLLKELTMSQSQGYRVYDPTGISVTIASGAGGLGAKTELYLTDFGIRRLTPLECERLQSFPDNWTRYGITERGVVEMSDARRYRAIGNAITVNVVSYIINKMFEKL